MIYKLTRDVKLMSTGFSRDAGQQIGENEIRNKPLWKAWLDEGIVVPEKPVPALAEPENEVAPLPQDTGATKSGKRINEVRFTPDGEAVRVERKQVVEPSPPPAPVVEEPIGDPQLRSLSDEELRAMGKRLKITSWHLMKREKLIQRIEEQS